MIVVELLKVISNLLGLISEEQSYLISIYLLKVLSLGLREREYLRLMNSTSNLDEMMDYAYECYICRSLDVDLFYEIQLLFLKDFDIVPVLKGGRLLRSIDILLKDATDLEYDIKHSIESPITTLS